jgi:hypothetical protein
MSDVKEPRFNHGLKRNMIVKRVANVTCLRIDSHKTKEDHAEIQVMTYRVYLDILLRVRVELEARLIQADISALVNSADPACIPSRRTRTVSVMPGKIIVFSYSPLRFRSA